MFDQEQVKAYRSVEAPEALRQQVMQGVKAARRRPRHGRVWAGTAALAACLALVLGLRLNAPKGAEVLVMGQTLKEGSVVRMADGAAGPARYAGEAEGSAPLVVELELHLDEPTRLETVGGTVTVLRDGESVEDWTALEGRVTVLWEIDPTPGDPKYQLDLHHGGTCQTVTLSYAEAQGGWIAQMTETPKNE